MTEAVLSWGPGESRLALVEDGRAVELVVARPDLVAGAVFLGRVTDVVAKINAAFVEIGQGRPGFLPGGQGLVQGQSVLVQVRADAQGGKGAVLTTDISFVGRYLAYSPFRPGLNLSRRLDAVARERLHGLLAPLLRPGEGMVVRTAAEGAGPDVLAAELDAQRGDWQAVEGRGALSAPALVWRPDPLARMLADHPRVERVWVDDDLAFAAARRRFGDLVRRGKPDFDMDDALAEALDPVVALPCGGRVRFEPTAALLAIDVDSGGAHPAEANAQAVPAIARHLRLRGIGGQGVVDFVSGGGKGAVARLAAALKAAVATDPVPTHVFGASPLGLVELTRERRGPSLAEIMQEWSCRPSTSALALSALRRVLAEAACRPGQRLALVAAPDLVTALASLGEAVAEAEARLGHKLAMRPDPGRAREDYFIEEV